MLIQHRRECGTLRTGRGSFSRHLSLVETACCVERVSPQRGATQLHGGHLAFSTPVRVFARLLTVGSEMFVPSGFLSPHSSTVPQAHSHGVLSCKSSQGAFPVGQHQFSNTSVRSRHQMSVARRCPHLAPSESRGDGTGLTAPCPACRCRHC